MKPINKKLIALLLGALFSFPAIADKHDALDRQGQFMAVYLLHFSNFIEWPKNSFNDDTHFNICINGKTEINNYINDIEGDNVKGRTIKILKNVLSDEIQKCQILFVSRNDYDLNAIKKYVMNEFVLLVSDKEDFISDGGAIQYYIENNKLRLAISNNSAKQKQLKISSKLLRITKIIEDGL